MGVLGKDLLDYKRPHSHTKVQFGESAYWIEDDPTAHPYGETLTDLLNDDLPLGTAPVGDMSIFDRRGWTAGALSGLRERYAWFLSELFMGTPCEKKKGQRKIPLAEQIYKSCLDAMVSGVSLGHSPEVDAPQVNIQYAVLEMEDGSHQLVEKMYFDRLGDFVYVELMKGLQKGFVPKQCPNCGRWFLQQPGMTYTYCDGLAPNSGGKTCREIGSSSSFQSKVKNNEVWKIHQRAYKKYFARTTAKTMSKTEFEAWGRESERLRDIALNRYNRAKTEEEKTTIIEELKRELNKA